MENEENLFQNFDESRKISMGTIGAMETGNYRMYGKYRNYRKLKNFYQNFDESREITKGIIENRNCGNFRNHTKPSNTKIYVKETPRGFF